MASPTQPKFCCAAVFGQTPAVVFRQSRFDTNKKDQRNVTVHAHVKCCPHCMSASALRKVDTDPGSERRRTPREANNIITA
eukprot:365679-Chlamydomonas_euryale.AAC.25